MTHVERLRKARVALRSAIVKSRGLPSEEAFELVRHAGLVASKIIREVTDEMEKAE